MITLARLQEDYREALAAYGDIGPQYLAAKARLDESREALKAALEADLRELAGDPAKTSAKAVRRHTGLLAKVRAVLSHGDAGDVTSEGLKMAFQLAFDGIGTAQIAAALSRIALEPDSLIERVSRGRYRYKSIVVIPPFASLGPANG